jgi:hypothetical protein
LRPGTARATRTGLGEGTSFRRAIGLGAVTVISGSDVAPPAAAGACVSWANAAPVHAHSSSDAELEASNLRLDENDIVLILPKPNPN